MRTTQATGISDRVAVGDDLLLAAKNQDTRSVAKRLVAFTKVHRSFVSANKVVLRADDAVSKQQALIGERDVDQDALVDALASDLVGDDFARVNPFTELGFDGASKIKSKGDVAEAKLCRQLVAAVLKNKRCGAKSRATAEKLDRAAKAVLVAAKPMGELSKSLQDAIKRRDVFALPWSKEFVALKRAARTADDDGAHGLFDALFVRDAKPVKKKKKAKSATDQAGGTGTPAGGSKPST